MRTNIFVGFRLILSSEYTEVVMISDNPDISYTPPDLELDAIVSSEEAAIAAVKEYFRKYKEVGHEDL